MTTIAAFAYDNYMTFWWLVLVENCNIKNYSRKKIHETKVFHFILNHIIVSLQFCTDLQIQTIIRFLQTYQPSIPKSEHSHSKNLHFLTIIISSLNPVTRPKPIHGHQSCHYAENTETPVHLCGNAENAENHGKPSTSVQKMQKTHNHNLYKYLDVR